MAKTRNRSAAKKIAFSEEDIQRAREAEESVLLKETEEVKDEEPLLLQQDETPALVRLGLAAGYLTIGAVLVTLGMNEVAQAILNA